VQTEDVIRQFQQDPACRAFVEEAYLDADTRAAAERFAASPEFVETLRYLPADRGPLCVLDLGAGTGIASWALASSGFGAVLAIEPDPSDVVGLGALRELTAGQPVRAIGAVGEHLPIADGTVDVVYCRQVLHHTHDLDAAVAECGRVLRSGGTFVACREHVVDDDAQLAQFLAEHPVHQLAGGEHAYSYPAYVGAIEGAGLRIEVEMDPWASIINAFPAVADAAELSRAPQVIVGRRFGKAGEVVAGLPGVNQALWARLRRRKPGRFYSFVATKP
jgi:SAM-dependent methyltransferase